MCKQESKCHPLILHKIAALEIFYNHSDRNELWIIKLEIGFLHILQKG